MLDFTTSQSSFVVERWRDILPPDDFDALLFSARVNRVAMLHRRILEYLAPEFGLSQVDAIIMFLLRGLDKEPISLSDICRIHEYTPGAVTHRIARLKKLDYVETKKSITDSRSVEVKLTEIGRDVIEKIISSSSAIFAEQLENLHLTPSKRTSFDQTLLAIELAAQKSAPSARKVRKAKPGRRTDSSRVSEKAKESIIL